MDLISEIIGQFIWRAISAPVVWILATPYILIMSFFGKDTYFKNMKMYYKRIKDYFWLLKEKNNSFIAQQRVCGSCAKY